MRRSKVHTGRRASTASGGLRGRQPKPDYGILLVLPFLAAAGGALIGLGVESMADRHRASSGVRATPG
jgi:hypothetical protein